MKLNLQFFGGRGSASGGAGASFSSQGTYAFDGQKAPKDLKTFSGRVQGNPTVDFRGTQYQVQNVIDYDSSEGGEYTAGHLYVPNSLDKGSFFVSQKGTLYHDGSQYLRDKGAAKAQGMSIDQYIKRRRAKGL